MTVILDLALLALIASLWLVKRFVVAPADWYDWAKKYGDPIHFALGSLTARLALDYSAYLVAVLIYIAFLVYEYFGGSATKEEAAKDVATYTAGLVAYTTLKFGIAWP